MFVEIRCMENAVKIAKTVHLEADYGIP